MSKFKLPLIVFSIVFIVTAGVLFYVLNKEMPEEAADKASAPGWVNKDGSSGRIELGEVPTFKVENATKKEKKAAEPNASTSAPATQDTARQEKDTQKVENKTAEKKDDKPRGLDIVTDFFLESLAEYTISNYHPAGSLPNTPARDMTSVSLRSINTHFGLNLRGLASDAPSIISAREEIWKNLLNPGNLQTAYDSYSDNFIDLLEDKSIIVERKFSTGGTRETRALTKEERINLFRVSARPLRQTAAILNTVASDSDLIKAMDGYIKAQRRVDSANAVFQKALAESNSHGTVAAKNRASHAGKLLKDAITVREKIKNGISEKIKSLCGGECDVQDSFYAAQWVYRRTKDNRHALKSILAGADLLSRLADKMEKRATLISRNM